jgi:hypothetical protein
MKCAAANHSYKDFKAMPRNSAGTYALPLPPVVAGNTIMASFENTTDSDIASELTNSLDRNGRGGMLAPFKIADGSVSAPGIAFTQDPDNGFYRIGTDDWAAAVGGAKVMEFTPGLVAIPSTLKASGQILAAAGTVGTPAYAFSSDPTLGLYTPASGIIGFTASGVERLRVHYAGLVLPPAHFLGWGSDATLSTLDVALMRNAAGVLEVNSGAGNDLRDLRLRTAYGVQYAFIGVPNTFISAPSASVVAINFDTTPYYYAAYYGFLPATDNALPLGAGTNRWTAVYSATGTIITSDARLKKNITDSALGLAFIEALRPVSYQWIVGKNVVTQKSEGEESVATPVPGVRTHWGLIAQEVKQAVDASGVADFAGYVRTDMADPESELGLRYDEFIAPLIKAVQELAARVVALEAAP